MTSSTEEMRGTRGERVNLRAKCFRYRGFFQWVILGVFALLALYVFANTDLLHLRGNRQTVKVDDKGTKNLDSLKVVHQKGEIQQPLKLDTKNTEQKSNFDEPDSEEKDNVDDDTKNEQKNTKQIDLSQTQQQAMNPETSQDGGKTKKQEEKPEQKLSHETHVAEQPVVANPAKQGTVGGNVKFPFQDPSKSWHERVEDLVGRMTLDEVIDQTLAVYRSKTEGIPRLGVNPYMWITECLHGQKGTGGTSYPQAVALAASFSPELVREVAGSIALEARATWNHNVKIGERRTMHGLTCFSPNINILRHPLWGRNQETYGEDPFLTGVTADAFVRGLQGDHARYVRSAASCKHFAAHNGPEKHPVSRLNFDAQVRESDMRMTYLPAFKSCVEAGALGIMCSYNRINGVPACAHKELLGKILREEWGFQGYVVSDANAVFYIREKHGYTDNDTAAVAAAVSAGVNLELATRGHRRYTLQKEALQDRLLTEKQIRDNIKPLMLTRMKLGEFDPPEMNPYNKVNESVVQSPAHRALATKAASSSFVLLKNTDQLLPLTGAKREKSITVIGPAAIQPETMYGAYGPHVNKNYAQSAWNGLKRIGDKVRYEKVCKDARCSNYDQEELRNATINTDVFIVTMIGNVESEFFDRPSFSPPGKYRSMVEQLAHLSSSPIVLLVFSGAATQLDWAHRLRNVSAILQCFLPGQSAGDAILNTLTAATPDDVPAARLPYSWPVSLEKMPKITNYNMEDGFTYRYSTEEPLYPFGFGLSYTSFKYETLEVEPKVVDSTSTLTVTVGVRNSGPLDANEVVQVYVSWMQPIAQIASLPKRQLVAFRRVRIKAGILEAVKLKVPGRQLMVWNSSVKKYEMLQATMKLYVGGQQPKQTMSVGSNVLEGEFTTTGNR